MVTLESLRTRDKSQIEDLARKHGALSLRVFGSVARGARLAGKAVLSSEWRTLPCHGAKMMELTGDNPGNRSEKDSGRTEPNHAAVERTGSLALQDQRNLFAHLGPGAIDDFQIPGDRAIIAAPELPHL